METSAGPTRPQTVLAFGALICVGVLYFDPFYSDPYWHLSNIFSDSSVLLIFTAVIVLANFVRGFDRYATFCALGLLAPWSVKVTYTLGAIIDNKNSLTIILWFATHVFLFILLLAIVLISIRRNLHWIQDSGLTNKAITLLGIFLTLLILLAEILPWIKNIYTSNGSWKFHASGTSRLVLQCCYLKDTGVWNIVSKLIPLAVLLIVFGVSILGYKLSNSILIGVLLFPIRDGIQLLTELGPQRPPSAWTSADIASNSLRYEIQATFGGYLYLFVLAVLCLVIVLQNILSNSFPNNSSKLRPKVLDLATEPNVDVSQQDF